MLLLTLFHIFDLFHMRVAQYIRHAMRLPEEVLRDIHDCMFGARLHTLGIAAAKIAFEWHRHVLVHKNGSKGTGFHAHVTGNTLLLQYLDHTVVTYNSVRRTTVRTFGFLALITDYGHPDHRMRIDDHRPNTALFGIVHFEMAYGAN